MSEFFGEMSWSPPENLRTLSELPGGGVRRQIVKIWLHRKVFGGIDFVSEFQAVNSKCLQIFIKVAVNQYATVIQCGTSGERIRRHNLQRDIIFGVCQEALLGPTMEQKHLIPDTNAKPGDIFLPGWLNGQDVAMDVSVTSPLQQSLVHKSAVSAGTAAEVRYKSKIFDHSDECKANNIFFQPLILETTGGWHPKSYAVLKRLGTQLSSHTEKSPSESVSHFMKSLAISLVKSNTALFRSRKPRFASQQIDGDLE